MNNIQKSIDYINKTYDKLSYFDLYGGVCVYVCMVDNYTCSVFSLHQDKYEA